MASVDYTLEGVQTGPDEYTLEMTVDAAVAMPSEIFLYEYSTRKFVKVADGSEMSFPTAPDASVAYYRLATATAVYDNLPSGLAAKNTNIPAAIQSLVNAYNADLTTFITSVSSTAS